MDTVHERDEICELADSELDAVTGGTVGNQAGVLLAGAHAGIALYRETGVCDDSV